MVSWLRGDGRSDTGAQVSAAEVQLRHPCRGRRAFATSSRSRVTSRRAGAGAESEIPPAWYEAPVFYFSNPASVQGPGQPVQRPAVDADARLRARDRGRDRRGRRDRRLHADERLERRDVQAQEMTVGLGPAKGKDFATSLGPWLVTPDELPMADGRLDLEATVSVNGEELSRTSAAEQHWSWEELARPRCARHHPRAGRRPGLRHAQRWLPARARAACRRALARAGRRGRDRGRGPRRARGRDRVTRHRHSTGRSNKRREDDLGLGSGDARRVAEALERLFQCSVSRAWRWRIALASPATVWAAATSGWRPAAARISDGRHPPLAEERDDGVGGPAEGDVVENRGVALNHAGLLEPVDPALHRGG